jgi:hypothetical protein
LIAFTHYLFLLALFHRLQLTEVSRQQIEQELMINNKDKAEIIEQFQHVKKREDSKHNL